MAAASAKNHDFHILPPSPWPLLGAFSCLVFAAGAIRWMHKLSFGPEIFALGVFGILLTMFLWWSSVIRESHEGDHTAVVSLHHRYGMILFIASEVMFFVAWFWAYYNAALFPSQVDSIGGVWPPKGIQVLDPFEFPLLNTFILLCSGTTVTWAHHALLDNDRKSLIQGLGLTIALGLLFTCVQAYEYSHAAFGLAGNVYGSTFYMATGFHGFHVIIGTIFLIVCFIRARRGEFTPQKHLGFEFAAWYWHFVDVVWLFLFLSIYLYGSHFGAAVSHAGA
jgi:cytochrome c oxidase subunit 3